MIDRLWQRGMRMCAQRDWSCWETNRKTKKRGKDGGRKCETEGEEEAMEVKREKERMGKKRQKKKNLAFYLLLIKFITFVSEGDWERDWQGHGCRERKRRREQLEIINRLIKLLFKERWIDRDEEQGNRRADSERGLGSMSGRETWWADVRGREMWWKRPEGKRHGGGRREKAVGSQESRLEGKTRRRESGLAYFISVKPIYIELKLRERADKVRRTGENR